MTTLPTRPQGLPPLRVLLLCTSDQGGGAAEACRRLLDALSEVGVEVRMLVVHKGTADERIASVATTPLRRLWAKAAFLLERLDIYLRNGRSRQQLFRVSTAKWGCDISTHPWVEQADIIHLHWINQGFLSLSTLRKLATLGKPIFSTLHDLWAATGICHLPLEMSPTGATECLRYQAGCGYCPLLKSKQEHDLSRTIFEQKRFLARPPFRYIAVSSAEGRLFEQSPLMQGYGAPIVLANPIDLSLFSPERAVATPLPFTREAGHYYLTIVAARLDEAVKGPHLLKELARQLRLRHPQLAERVTLLLVGSIRQPGYLDDLALPHIALGSIRDRAQLASIYAASDALLSTSVYETFGQTLVEALSVGTPALSFRCSGPEDIIIDGINGYLIPAFDTETYADRLAQLLERQTCAEGAFSPKICRESALRFGAPAIATRLVELYRTALGSH